MQNSIAIKVENVSKTYKLYEKPIDRLKEAVSVTRKCYHKEFYALNDISFEVKRGETVGIIGTNGSGKSTLLKILTGVLNATAGLVEVDGKISALLELGAGFNSEYTGIENIYLNGTIMGYTRAEIEKKIPQIIEFADIGDFINQPVKTYSSGMFVRLAFATQIYSDPDVLIVDEALSVGDIRFQQKCYRAMEQLMKDKTVVLVTHDTAAVARFCKRVLWINKGEILFDGQVKEGLEKYQEYLINQDILDHGYKSYKVNDSLSIIEQNDKKRSAIPKVSENVIKKGNGKAEITHCALVDENGKILEIVEPNKKVCFIVQVSFYEKIDRPILGMTFFDRLGNTIFAINSEMINVQLPRANGAVEYRFSFIVPQLNQGEYTISPGLASGYQDEHIQLCWIDDAYVFRVPQRNYDIPGFFYLDQGMLEVIKL